MPKCMRCMQDYEAMEYCPFCGNSSQMPAEDMGQIPEETILKRRFIIGQVISRDKIGFTYIAWDALLERKVAVKECFPGAFAQREEDGQNVKSCMEEMLWEELCQQFLKKAESLHRMQKLSVLAPVYMSFQENHTAYYVMEYLEGMSLREILERENPVSPSRAKEYMDQIHKGLEILHGEGLFHGNLTPENIYFCRNGEVKFLNLAWFSRELEKIKYAVFQTRYASFVYSHSPVVPELSMDTYSENAVYYRLLTGEEPVSALRRLKKEKLPSIREYGIEVPLDVEKAVMEGMQARAGGEKGLGFLRVLQGLHVLLLAAVVVMGVLIII